LGSNPFTFEEALWADCKVAQVGESLLTQPYGWAANDVIVHAVSHYVNTLTTEGALDDILRRWSPINDCAAEQADSSSFSSQLTPGSFVGPMLLLVVTVLAAVGVHGAIKCATHVRTSAHLKHMVSRGGDRPKGVEMQSNTLEGVEMVRADSSHARPLTMGDMQSNMLAWKTKMNEHLLEWQVMVDRHEQALQYLPTPQDGEGGGDFSFSNPTHNVAAEAVPVSSHAGGKFGPV
jgi:hypothetical protein